MHRPALALLALSLLGGCSWLHPQPPKTPGDPSFAGSYGYHPIDPLPVELKCPAPCDNRSKRVLDLLPDETMRLAIGQVDATVGISYGPVKVGYAGNDYVVVLDYVKFDTQSFPVEVARDTKTGEVKDLMIAQKASAGSALVPTYIGVGLRLTASVHVNSGEIDLGNLFGLGAAAQAKQVSGTLVIQTLGISGPGISPIIPMPSEISAATIQNAILALGSIKAKIYEPDTEIDPRVVGVYNNQGGGVHAINSFISGILQQPPQIVVPPEPAIATAPPVTPTPAPH